MDRTFSNTAIVLITKQKWNWVGPISRTGVDMLGKQVIPSSQTLIGTEIGLYINTEKKFGLLKKNNNKPYLEKLRTVTANFSSTNNYLMFLR